MSDVVVRHGDISDKHVEPSFARREARGVMESRFAPTETLGTFFSLLISTPYRTPLRIPSFPLNRDSHLATPSVDPS